MSFSLRRGDSYAWTVTLTDGVNPIDLSGKTLTFTVKQNKTDTDLQALLQVSVTFPSDANSLAGQGELFVPYTATANLPADTRVYYDFQLSYLDGQGRTIVTTLTAGSVKVDWEITETVP